MLFQTLPSLRPKIRIDSAELRLVELKLLNPFRISTGVATKKTFPLLILRSGNLEGYAEGVSDTLPDYLPETTVSSMMMMRDVFLPQIIGKEFSTPYELSQMMRLWRDHHMAKACVEMAYWDLWSKTLGLSLSHALGGTRKEVEVGVSLGIKEFSDTLLDVERHVQQGYRRIKLKVMPDHDVKLLEKVRNRFPDIHLTVDANCAYTLADMPLLRTFDNFALDYIEQPLAWDDLQDHAKLQSLLRTAVCLDECIRTPELCRKALAIDAGRVINIKVGRVGGHANARQIHDICQAHDVPVWCGGMLESGIGRAHNIHLSTLEQFKRPGDTSSSSRYFERDIICEKLEAENGIMPVPLHGAGIGVSLDYDYLESVTLSKELF